MSHFLEDLRKIYGDRAVDCAMCIINAMAPVTRRDDWWSTDGPYEIIIRHLKLFAEAEK